MRESIYRSGCYRSSNIGKIRDLIVEWLDLAGNGLDVIFKICDSGKRSSKEQGENIEIGLELHDKLRVNLRPEYEDSERVTWTLFYTLIR